MKILLLAPHPFYTNRGTPIAVKLVCEGLTSMGHTVDVLTYHEGAPVSLPGVMVHRIHRPPFVRRVPIGPSWQKLICDLAMIREFRRMLRKTCYDVVHAVEESAFMAARCGVPFVFDMDSLMSRQILEKSPLFWPAAKVFEWLEHHALRRCVGVVAVCKALVEQARKYQSNVCLLPDVALDGNGQGALPPAITEAKGLRFMYVGNLERYQGVDLMLQAFNLASQDRKDAVLLVVGGSPQQIQAYQEKVKSLSASIRIHFAGAVPVECLGRVLTYADVLISPRIKGDNTPMKLYSYLLSGKPVLATRLPMHTQVLDDETALLVEPTTSAMADGLRRLMDSKTLRETLGDAGRRLALCDYSLAAYRQRLQNFYQGITP